jgi:hypothetical protein
VMPAALILLWIGIGLALQAHPVTWAFVSYPSQLGPGMTGRAVTSTDDGKTWS